MSNDTPKAVSSASVLLGPKDNPNPLLTETETSVYINVAKSSLAVWRCTGRHALPFVKLGRKVFYRRSDLDDFIAAGLRGAKAEGEQ